MARPIVVVFLLLAVSLCAFSCAEAAGINANQRGGSDHRSAFQRIASSISDKIKHIIILMEENRSFDHMFGFYGKGTNGLTGKEYNLVDVNDPNSKKVYVDNQAPYINKCDPTHDAVRTTLKIFGNLSRAEKCNFTCEDMSGFVSVEAFMGKGKPTNTYCNVMQALDNKEKLPVLTALADEFVLMDRFFAAMPGPTWPNRLFHLSATSAGLTETFPWYQNVPGKLFPQKTIFDQVDKVGGEWRVYYNDTPWEMMLETVAHNPDKLLTMTEFFADCQNGNLPDYAFINPRSGVNLTERVGSNDHHPDHDIRAGEQYYKDIYEALRASPQWNETLFIITYDEHGGFYDHVTPPLNAPIPDSETSYPGDFLFNRLGVRIPTLLISPWVPKGYVLGRAPEAQRPFPDSEYDLTSIMASARKILKKLEGVPPLTKRDAWVSTFEHVLGMVGDAPRTDCPMHLPDPERPQPADIVAEAQQPVNDLQVDILHMHHVLANPHLDHSGITYGGGAKSSSTVPLYPEHITEQRHVANYLQHSFAQHKHRTLEWKASKKKATAASAEKASKTKEENASEEKRTHGDSLVLRGAPVPGVEVEYGPSRVTKVVNSMWKIQKSSDATNAFFVTISGNLTNVTSLTSEVCLTAPSLTVGGAVTVSVCSPSSDPNTSTDKTQQWYYRPDTTIRPVGNSALCLSTDVYKGKSDKNPFGKAFLVKCDPDDVFQHHGYDGAAPGASDACYGIWVGASYLVAVRN